MTDDKPGRSTPTPDEPLHNPWDASCSRNGFGEPSREGERCLVCFPARPPVGDTTGTDESIRYSDGLPVTEAHRSDFEMRAIGAHARNDWERERRALDAIHLLDIAERDRGDTTQPQPTAEPQCENCGAKWDGVQPCTECWEGDHKTALQAAKEAAQQIPEQRREKLEADFEAAAEAARLHATYSRPTQPQPTDEPPRCDCGLPAASGSNFCSDCLPSCRHGNVLEAVAEIRALAEQWRYKGEFGWGPWQIGEGPDQEGYVLDQAAAQIRTILDEAGCL